MGDDSSAPHCPRCGAETPAGARFCTQCGSLLDTSAGGGHTSSTLIVALAAAGVLFVGLLIVVIGAGAYVMTRLAQPAPAQPGASAGGTYLTGHIFDAATGKAVILAYVVVLRPGVDPNSDWGKEKGAALALGGTTDVSGSFKTDPPVPKGATYPILVFNINSNVVTKNLTIAANAPDVMDLGEFRLQIQSAGAAPAGSAPPPSMQRYADSKGRFSIDYPAGWTVRPNPVEAGTVLVATKANSSAAFTVVTDLVAAAGPEDVATQNESVYRQNHPTYRQVQGGPTVVAGQSAYYVYFTEQTAKANVYVIHVYVPVKRQRVFVLEGVALNDPQHIRDDFPVILRMIDSFRPAP